MDGDKDGRRSPAVGETGPGGRYTMAQVAALKKVSYHTVSRAVRSGRLPSTRVGRMSLVAAEDVDRWTPKRDRAPRKYRDRVGAGEEPAVDRRYGISDTAEMIDTMSGQFQRLHNLSQTGTSGDVANELAVFMANVLGLTRATVWAEIKPGEFGRVGRYGQRISGAPDSLDAEDITTPANAGQHRARVTDVPNLPNLVPASFSALLPNGPVIVMPMQVDGVHVATLTGDRDGSVLDISPEHMEVAERLASNLAFVFQFARMRERMEASLQVLTAVLDDARSGVELRDSLGNLIFANQSHLALLDRSWTWTDADTGFVISRGDDIVSRVLETGRGQEIVVTGEHEDGRHRVLRIAIDVVRSNDQVVGAKAITKVIAPEIERERSLRAEVERLRSDLRAVSGLQMSMNRINEQATLASVMDTMISEINAHVGSHRGIGIVPDAAGRYTVLTTVGFGEAPATDVAIDCDSFPTVARAGDEKRARVVRRNEAGAGEREILARHDADSMLVVPIRNTSELQGAVILFSGIESANSGSALQFATSVGRRSDRIASMLRLTHDLERSGRQVMAAINQLSDAVLVFDATHTSVEVANRAAIDLLGLDFDAARVQAADLVMDNAEGHRLDGDTHPALRAMRTGMTSTDDTILVHRADGTTVRVVASHAPYYRRDGTMAGVVGIYREASEGHSLTDTRDEFLGMVAHELRNPLTSLRGNLQLIQRRMHKRRLDGAEHEHEEADRIGLVIEQADRISELVGRLLDVSRLDLGRLDLSLQPTDASALVQSVIERSMGMAADRQILVTAPESLPVVWDQVRIEQVLVNLLSNALKYAPEGPIDVLVTRPDGDTVEISVHDNGPGIPPDVLERLFKQYYKLDSGGKDRVSDGTKGLGIGMYISARLARAHGGGLTAENAPGGGALFRLKLPLEASPRATAERSADTEGDRVRS